MDLGVPPAPQATPPSVVPLYLLLCSSAKGCRFTTSRGNRVDGKYIRMDRLFQSHITFPASSPIIKKARHYHRAFFIVLYKLLCSAGTYLRN